MYKPTLCLDFDGTCTVYSSWQGAATIPDPPVEGLFDFIRAAREHFEVVIFSSRSDQPGGIEAMQEWFIKHGWDADDPLDFPTIKPIATVSIDDRAITFTGQWPEMETLVNFKPWYKQ